MSWEIIIKPDGAVESVKVSTAVGEREITDNYSKEDLSNYSIETKSEEVPLSELFNSGVKKIVARSDTDNALLVQRQEERDNGDEQEDTTDPNDVPAPPLVDTREVTGKAKQDYYERLIRSANYQDESQPSVIRKLIYQHSPLTKGELAEMAEEYGYEPTSGGFGSCLRVLNTVTQEIEREGRGDSEQITWIGKE